MTKATAQNMCMVLTEKFLKATVSTVTMRLCGRPTATLTTLWFRQKNGTAGHLYTQHFTMTMVILKNGNTSAMVKL